MKLSFAYLSAACAGGLATAAGFLFHAGAQDHSTPLTTSLDTAIFAGGCFWCVESDFDKVDGVVETISGYTGGYSSDPTYETHARQGHVEAVKVIYDPVRVDYGQLVDYFLHHVDPTDDGGQFCDRGDNYRTVIFVENAEERAIATRRIALVDEGGYLPARVVTRILDETPFWRAESKHQDFYQKQPVRYNFYRSGCGRDERIKAIWSRTDPADTP